MRSRVTNVILGTVIAALALGAIAALGYAASAPRSPGSFTEFYVLGIGGKAEDYPQVFTFENGSVVKVGYGFGRAGDAPTRTVNGQCGEVTIGVANRQKSSETYSLDATVDGEPLSLRFEGKEVKSIPSFQLLQGQKWERVIGFSPLHLGTNQLVELRLFGEDRSAPQSTLYLHIDAVE